jgi:uracil-DNA glycosylase
MDLSTNNYEHKPWNETFPDHNVSLKNLVTDRTWKYVIGKEMEKSYFDKLEKFLTHALKSTDAKVKMYPYPDLVFNAFNLVPLHTIKVVIIGQDPYHQNEVHNEQIIPQAMGLSFSVPTGIAVPSSLKNIYQNLVDFGHIKKAPSHGNLTKWANQGCMMLNTSLTVQHGYPNSHAKFWQEFTDTIIKYISERTDNVIFVLWGSPALKKLEMIDTKKHGVTISSHPSGLSNTKPLQSYPAFSKCDHFGEINKFLEKHNKTKIEWAL